MTEVSHFHDKIFPFRVWSQHINKKVMLSIMFACVCVRERESNHRASGECRHVAPCFEYYQMNACGNPEAGHTHASLLLSNSVITHTRRLLHAWNDAVETYKKHTKHKHQQLLFNEAVCFTLVSLRVHAELLCFFFGRQKTVKTVQNHNFVIS